MAEADDFVKDKLLHRLPNVKEARVHLVRVRVMARVMVRVGLLQWLPLREAVRTLQPAQDISRSVLAILMF